MTQVVPKYTVKSAYRCYIIVLVQISHVVISVSPSGMPLMRFEVEMNVESHTDVANSRRSSQKTCFQSYHKHYELFQCVDLRADTEASPVAQYIGSRAST